MLQPQLSAQHSGVVMCFVRVLPCRVTAAGTGFEGAAADEQAYANAYCKAEMPTKYLQPDTVHKPRQQLSLSLQSCQACLYVGNTEKQLTALQRQTYAPGPSGVSFSSWAWKLD